MTYRSYLRHFVWPSSDRPGSLVNRQSVCRHPSVYTHVLSPADLKYLTVPFYIQQFDFCCSEVNFLYVKLQGYFYSPAPASMFNVKSILYNVHIVHSTPPATCIILMKQLIVKKGWKCMIYRFADDFTKII